MFYGMDSVGVFEEAYLGALNEAYLPYGLGTFQGLGALGARKTKAERQAARQKLKADKQACRAAGKKWRGGACVAKPVRQTRPTRPAKPAKLTRPQRRDFRKECIAAGNQWKRGRCIAREVGGAPVTRPAPVVRVPRAQKRCEARGGVYDASLRRGRRCVMPGTPGPLPGGQPSRPGRPSKEERLAKQLERAAKRCTNRGGVFDAAARRGRRCVITRPGRPERPGRPGRLTKEERQAARLEKAEERCENRGGFFDPTARRGRRCVIERAGRPGRLTKEERREARLEKAEERCDNRGGIFDPDARRGRRCVVERGARPGKPGRDRFARARNRCSKRGGEFDESLRRGQRCTFPIAEAIQKKRLCKKQSYYWYDKSCHADPEAAFVGPGGVVTPPDLGPSQDERTFLWDGYVACIQKQQQGYKIACQRPVVPPPDDFMWPFGFGLDDIPGGPGFDIGPDLDPGPDFITGGGDGGAGVEDGARFGPGGGGGGASFGPGGAPWLDPIDQGQVTGSSVAEAGPMHECDPAFSQTLPREYSDAYGPMLVLTVVCGAAVAQAAGIPARAGSALPGIVGQSSIEQGEINEIVSGGAIDYV